MSALTLAKPALPSTRTHWKATEAHDTTACGINLDTALGVTFTYDSALVVGQCPYCETAVHSLTPSVRRVGAQYVAAMDLSGWSFVTGF